MVATTSLGNQEKSFDAEKNLWYKVDSGRFEALAEAVASEILRDYTNAQQLPNVEVARYWIKCGMVHKRECVLSVSENFRRKDDSIVPVNTILQNAVGKNYLAEFIRRKTLQDSMKYLVDTVERNTGIKKFGEYLTILFEIDALVLNQDRHLNSIAVLSTMSGYRPCPVFDHDASFLLDTGRYRLDVPTKSYLSQAQALPFRTSFTRLVHVVQSLYGTHLKVDFSKEDVLRLTEKYTEYYPKPLAPYLQERITTVLMTQKAKLFKK